MFRFVTTLRTIAGCVLLALALTSSASAEDEIFRVTNVKIDDSLNIRQTPSSDAPITGTVPWNGTQILRIGECHEWCRIRYKTVEGWVNR